MTATATHTAALETAFAAFNERSRLLERSYRDLQEQVSVLTSKLAREQSARQRELLARVRLGERLARTLDALPGAVVLLDSQGIVRDRNALAAELLNQPLRGRPWSEIARREFASGEHNGTDLQLNDGRILSLQRRRLGVNDGEILLLTDVTESRRTAALLARRRRLSEIGETSSRLAHQIRTPLASALLYASQLPADGQGGRIVERLRELERIVRDMLQYAGGIRHDDQRIDVGGLLADVAETARPRCGSCVVTALPADGLYVAGNRDALKGALLNLVDNAAIAGGPGQGRVELAAVRERERVCLTVSDNGPGIPAPLQAKIFEPFFTTRPQGTGLGLAVVRSVADAHGGEVLLNSDDAGTTVALCIPVAKAPCTETSDA